jgi:hypothetical protein
MMFEKRSRIVLILPAPKTYLVFLVVDRIVDSIREFCGGCSETLDIPPVVKGRWYNKRTQQTVYDDVITVFGDADIDIDDPDLWQRLNQIKREAQRDLKEEIIWITAHEVRRAAEEDYLI